MSVAQRIMSGCNALARCLDSTTARTRIVLSKGSEAAHALALDRLREAGMSARIDAVGNVVGRYEAQNPDAPCLLLGSHLDTVRDAGKYDGMLGVVTAIECIRALSERGQRLSHAIEVISFVDEDGVRFNATRIGRHAVTGRLSSEVLTLRDRDGVSLKAASLAAGLDPPPPK
jgi:allantoate deiminase